MAGLGDGIIVSEILATCLSVRLTLKHVSRARAHFKVFTARINIIRKVNLLVFGSVSICLSGMKSMCLCTNQAVVIGVLFCSHFQQYNYTHRGTGDVVCDR